MKYVYVAWFSYGDDEIGIYSSREKAAKALAAECKYDHSLPGRIGTCEHPHTTRLTTNNGFCGITRTEIQ